MMAGLIVFLALVGGVLLWSLLLYNRLVRLRQHVRESWADIDVQLKRRHDLIPNLVATVQGYAAHEQAVLGELTRARTAALAIAPGPARAGAAETPLVAALTAVLAVAERYPELKADRQFRDLQRELAETEDRIAAARRFFNANVRDLNTLCAQFPALVVARAGGFQPVEFFQLEAAAERAGPVVRL